MPSENALMIPKTSDGRILFVIPWQGKTLVGTTDTPIEKLELEPKALEKEIEFVLETAQNYFVKSPRRADILSIFVGIRPLVKKDKTKNTAALPRDHTIEIDESRFADHYRRKMDDLPANGGRRGQSRDCQNRFARKILPYKKSANSRFWQRRKNF
ncbi:MAG: FAD-dependent oxidoreductase [Pyrinomonadaceae bacterium]